MNVAIIGYGVEGQSALRYWQNLGAAITVCDQNKTLTVPTGVSTQLGDDYLNNLDDFDVIVRSAGIHPDKILHKNPGVEDKITTVIDEFLRVCPTKNTIGVTGTKGKGTTSTLIARILEAAGKQVFLGGNIGNSPLDFLPKITPDSWAVLELSSFQLFDIRRAPHISVCLMIAQDHLDWHSDLADYHRAKQRLFAHQTSNDIAIYFANNETSKQIAAASPGRKIPYFVPPGATVQDDQIAIDSTPIIPTSKIKLLGKHNWQNTCAAVTAVWQIVQNPTVIRQVLSTFAGLPHRLEFVREVNKVQYYNDSLSTNPETTRVAIEAFTEPKVIILGGSDKGADFDQLAQTVQKNNVRHVILIGKMAGKIQTSLERAGFTNFSPGGKTMTDIVAAAKKQAKPGDVVLLSTATASFDMFKNYKDRGEQFKSAVQAL